MALVGQALSDDTLMLAWARVKANGGVGGTDGVSLADFSNGAMGRIARLRDQVRDGRYTPQPLLQVALPRPGRGPRLLAIPAVRDRILQTAVTMVLNPILDPHFEDESYAYRPGRSVRQAVDRVAQLRDAGYVVAVDADIHSFFDNIPHQQLLERYAMYVDDASLLPLISGWLNTPIQTAEGLVRPLAGIAQGSPLSPLLANLYLDGFDEAIAVGERRLVRYADDFVILCRDIQSAEQALEDAALWLGAAGLDLNYDKTRLTTFDHGISFLGVRFTKDDVFAEDPVAAPWLLPMRYLSKLPKAQQASPTKRDPSSNAARKKTPNLPAQATHKPSTDHTTPRAEDIHHSAGVTYEEGASPLLRTLYLAEPGAYLHKKGGRLVVDRGDDNFIDLPLEKVDQVLIADEGAISFGALRALLERGSSVAIQGFSGEVQGAFINVADSRIELRRKQHRRADDLDFCLGAARAIVAGKISNQRLVLRRYYRFRPEKTNSAEIIMREMQAKALSAASLDAIRGCEGSAARAYFAAWSELLPETWAMNGRTKNPPRDPVNALLSYGYGVLFHNLLTLITQRGLDPGLGALHACHNGHPALVSDLMEEFRSIVVDVVVLNLLQRGHVTHHDFAVEEPQNGCRISVSARKTLIRSMEEKLAAQLTHPITSQNMDYRRAMRQQVAHWVDVVENRAPVYRPCVLR